LLDARQLNPRPSILTTIELADLDFIGEMRFLMARMVGVSYVIGLNAALLSYFTVLKHLRPYLGVPLVLVVYMEARNFTMKSMMD